MKIQRISQFQGTFQFPNFITSQTEYYDSFLSTDLGMIYQSIPWEKLVQHFGLRDSNKGPKCIFSPRGKIALMFLKHYACCSDRKLIEQLNGNIDYQFFCDLHIPPGHRLTNYKIVSEIRIELSKELKIHKAQKILIEDWLPYMDNLNSISCDATCYESYVRFPTDVKLLWECVRWSYLKLKRMCKQLGCRMIRSKYKKWATRYSEYSKMKRKTKKKKIPLTRALLLLLSKFNEALTLVEQPFWSELPNRYKSRRETIQKIYIQQYELFHEGETPKNRIISIDKPYLRPIIRGKEIKKVEFGAKLHKLQIDGISFIEHLDFNAFHEGIRLQQTIYMAQTLTHRQVKLVGADGIYATNVNRKFVTRNNIKTDFKQKGRMSKKHGTHKKQIAKMITKERASRLEGSFGTDKEHFLLNRIKARTKETETLWIFFGIHTSNALKIGRRMEKLKKKAA